MQYKHYAIGTAQPGRATIVFACGIAIMRFFWVHHFGRVGSRMLFPLTSMRIGLSCMTSSKE
jgi:hypothetical protein